MDPRANAPLPAPPQFPRRIVYFGTPEMAVPPLEALIEAGFDVALVITGEDRHRGRRAAATPSPVKATALEHGIDIAHDQAAAAEVEADLGVVVAYGIILRRPILDRLPMVNLHFSLLPRWRGAAPVERALLAGDERTGVCVMAVEEGLDTGGVYAVEELTIRRSSTAGELSRQLTTVGSRLLVDTLTAGLGTPTPQVGEATYAAKLTTADMRIDWAQPASQIDRVIRVGGAWTTFRGRRLKVHSARPIDEGGAGDAGQIHGSLVTCGDETALDLIEVQIEDRGRARFSDWANGSHPEPGEMLGGDR